MASNIAGCRSYPHCPFGRHAPRTLVADARRVHRVHARFCTYHEPPFSMAITRSKSRGLVQHTSPLSSVFCLFLPSPLGDHARESGCTLPIIPMVERMKINRLNMYEPISFWSVPPRYRFHPKAVPRYRTIKKGHTINQPNLAKNI